jgi:hypothetical protein
MELENFENNIFLANFEQFKKKNNKIIFKFYQKIWRFFPKIFQEYSPKNSHLSGKSGSY